MKTRAKRAIELKSHICPTCKASVVAIDFDTFNGGFAEGIKAAADFVSQFDSTVNHDYLLSDCILSKFNMLKKPRKNKRKHVIVGIWTYK